MQAALRLHSTHASDAMRCYADHCQTLPLHCLLLLLRQVCESQMELAKLQESNDILEIRLDMALQQSAEARRKALEAEATAAAVITTPAHQLALAAAVAAAGRGSSDASDNEGGDPEAAAAAADSSTPAEKLQQQRSRRLRQQELLSAGSGGSLHELAQRRDPVDIEADSLLHSLGMPPIQELPSPSGDEQDDDAGNSSSGVAAAVAQRLAARRERYWRGAGASSSGRGAGALLRAAAEGWPSQEGADGAARRTSSNAPSRRSSATAQDLAGKLDALEGEWQAYQRSVAAAAAGGSTRRSLSGGGSVWPGGRRSSSVPASPRTGVSAMGQGGTPLGTPAGRQRQQQFYQQGRRVSLSATNSPVGRAWVSQDDSTAGDAGNAGTSSSGHSGEQPPQQGLLSRGISGISSWVKMGRDVVAAIGGAKDRPSEETVDNVVKSLNFQEADERLGRSPALSPLGTPRASRHSSSSSPDTAARRRPSDMQQQHKQDKPGSNLGRTGSLPAASNSQQADEEIFLLDSGDADDERAGENSRSRAREHGTVDDATAEDSDEFEDAEDDGDDEEEDPDYDPVLHATPAAPRRSSRQSGRHGTSRAARGSVSSEQGANWLNRPCMLAHFSLYLSIQSSPVGPRLQPCCHDCVVTPFLSCMLLAVHDRHYLATQETCVASHDAVCFTALLPASCLQMATPAGPAAAAGAAPHTSNSSSSNRPQGLVARQQQQWRATWQPRSASIMRSVRAGSGLC